MECISLCGISCLCALSASAFIDSSLHQLDFFLEIFHGNYPLNEKGYVCSPCSVSTMKFVQSLSSLVCGLFRCVL